MNGKAFGFVPRELDYDYDHSPDCSTPIEQSQWKSVSIPVQAVLHEVVAAGRIPPQMLEDAKLTHVLMLGLEHWGRLYSAAELKGYTIELIQR